MGHFRIRGQGAVPHCNSLGESGEDLHFHYTVFLMKTPIIALSILLGSLQLSHAGGNSSVVELAEVTSIKIEAERIIIVGSGSLSVRKTGKDQ